MITKGERTELRSIVRQQFKVLRSEVQQREAEMRADLETQIHDRFAADDQQWSVLMHNVNEAVLEANRRINDALAEAGYQQKGASERQWVQSPNIRQPKEDEHQLRMVASTQVTAQVKAALLRLEREEADLLRTLAIGAIESAEARQFLSSIPTVSELVPAARLSELEASLREEYPQ